MRIDEQARKCVSFLAIQKPGSQPESIALVAVGTLFYVGIRQDNDRWVAYGITARHVVDASRPDGDLFIRLVDSNGNTVPMRIPVDLWWAHPNTDVAAIRISFNLAEYGLQFLPTDLFATPDWLNQHNVGVGDRLVISGMFSNYVGSLRDEPILRFGRISLMPTEKLRMPPQDHSPEMEIEVILAEAASWGGQSGSPTFVYFSFDRSLFVGDRVEMRLPNPRLLGLVHGHYNIVQRVLEKDTEYPDLRVPLNAGIAIIVPAMKILELLNDPSVVEDRETRAAQEEGG